MIWALVCIAGQYGDQFQNEDRATKENNENKKQRTNKMKGKKL